MPTLSVFTPAYNRANTIGRTYESLCRQTSKDFEWIIIDDGSTDNTRELVRSWLMPSSIEEKGNAIIGYSADQPWLHIHYCYKENGGLHTGYNKAIELIDTELCVCIDSDDYMPDDAVAIILETWKKKGNDNLAGIIGCDYIIGDTKPIGGDLPEEVGTCHFLDLQYKYHHHGDTKMVLRTSLLKPIAPMHSYPGEKNFNPIYLYMLIDPNLEYIIINKNLCFVDYQPTGMSVNIYNQFRNSPRSFAALRRVSMTHPRTPFYKKLKDAIHTVSSAIFAKDFGIIRQSPMPITTILVSPLGVLLNLYLRKKTSK
jgi:glycosyltransferase involved in cell wall biosynthesis